MRPRDSVNTADRARAARTSWQLASYAAALDDEPRMRGYAREAVAAAAGIDDDLLREAFGSCAGFLALDAESPALPHDLQRIRRERFERNRR